MSKRLNQNTAAKHHPSSGSPANSGESSNPIASCTSQPTQSSEGPQDWTSYFSAREWALYVTIILAGLVLRWTMLDMRPYHHDESLHGMYGRYFYDWPNSNFYKYDPMLHGPMLYNCMRFIYAMFGDSLWAARTPVCIMGSLFLFVPFLYRSYLKRATTLVLTGAVALSPTMIYWSRFLREDYWVVSGMLFCLFGFTIAPRNWRAFLVFFGLTVQWCTKENVFVTLAIVIGYFAFEYLFQKVVTLTLRAVARGVFIAALVGILAGSIIGSFTGSLVGAPIGLALGILCGAIVGSCVAVYILGTRDSEFGRTWQFVSHNLPLVCLSFLASFVIFAWFYGAGGRYWQGVIDGFGGKAISYWSAHHAMERIKGPFNFHVYVTAWYELPVFVAFLVHVGLFYRRAIKPIQLCAGLVVMAMLVSCFLTNNATIEQNAFWKPFKLKNNLDIIGLFILLFHAPLVTIQHLLRRERILAATGYFFTATFFSYSYLGEKVPWLSVYPLVFGLPYLALFFQDYFQKHPFNYRNYSVANFFVWIGVILMVFGAVFYVEQRGETDKNQIRENISILTFGCIFALGGLLANIVFNRPKDSPTILGTMHLGRWSAVIVAIFTIRAAVQTNFLYAGKETEYLSQVHTTYELAEHAKHIIDQALFERNGFKPKVYATGESTWPLTWYFRVIPEQYKFSVKDRSELQEFAYIFLSWKEKHDPSEIPEGYIQRRVNLRGWWVPDFNQVSLKKFLRYSINHYPWNPSGFSYATMLTAKDMERFRN